MANEQHLKAAVRDGVELERSDTAHLCWVAASKVRDELYLTG
ncbi:MAG: hypothetical protein ABSB50_08230 [Terracidiphilus sp.]|jgi:hypothetical protein